MRERSGLHVPDLLMGLAPAAGTTCARCGGRTSGLVNGRGRLDFCAACGTLELESAEGLSLMSLRDLALPAASRSPPPVKAALQRAAAGTSENGEKGSGVA